MKKLGMLMIVALVLLFGLNGCGTDTETIYVEVPQTETGAKISITSSSTQEMQLHLNSDGTLFELESGSHKVYPDDISIIVFSSDRVGRYENSRVFGELDANLNVHFKGLLNNDAGLFYAILKDGRTMQVIPNKKATTYKEMDYLITSDGWYQYGVQAEVSSSVFFSPDGKVTISMLIGADTLYGLVGNVYRTDWVRMKFVSSDGQIAYTEIQRSEKSDNLSLIIGGITITPIIDQYRSVVSGKLYAVASDGTEVEMNFDWRTQGLNWYLSSETDKLYSYFNEETGYIDIEYYTPYIY